MKKEKDDFFQCSYIWCLLREGVKRGGVRVTEREREVLILIQFSKECMGWGCETVKTVRVCMYYIRCGFQYIYE